MSTPAERLTCQCQTAYSTLIALITLTQGNQPPLTKDTRFVVPRSEAVPNTVKAHPTIAIIAARRLCASNCWGPQTSSAQMQVTTSARKGRNIRPTHKPLSLTIWSPARLRQKLGNRNYQKQMTGEGTKASRRTQASMTATCSERYALLVM